MKTPIPKSVPVGYYLKINVKTVLEASLLVSDSVPLCSLMI